MQILEDLYLSVVNPSKRSFKHNSQYAKALDEVVKAGDALTESLIEEQKELFEDYMTAQREVNVLTDCERFCLAFKLGAKIIVDVLTDGQMREIRIGVLFQKFSPTGNRSYTPVRQSPESR